MVFASQEWRDQFVAQFEALRNFAWANEKQFQLMKEPPVDTDAAPQAARQRYGLKPEADEDALVGYGGHSRPKSAGTARGKKRYPSPKGDS
jgi:hypothetical protein